MIAPTIELEKEYRTMLAAWEATGEKLIPFVLRYDASDFPALIQKLEASETEEGVEENFVPHHTFWLVDDSNTILGIINIRSQMTERLAIVGGHIGYGITPGQRRKGYATEILHLGLIEAKKLGIDRALVTCHKGNTGSERTIIKNGGVLAQQHYVEGEGEILGFWIDNP